MNREMRRKLKGMGISEGRYEMLVSKEREGQIGKYLDLMDYKIAKGEARVADFQKVMEI
jgi:hypothetical protein